MISESENIRLTAQMGAERERASQGSKFAAHVRFGSKADIGLLRADVRFAPESGHVAISLGMSA